jgi:hypothetical protein
MKRLSICTTLLALVITSLFFVTTALAGRGNKGNGFPCGEHYNLNLISKKDGFTCPEEPTENVIYIPTDEEIQIFIESGKKKDMYTDFIVTDWCAGLEEGDTSASLVLPTNQDVYHVYARAVGTLGDDLNLTIGDPGLNFVMDENGNNLLELGIIDQNGLTPSLNNTDPIERKKGGKNNKAVDITKLFVWSGELCYFSVDITDEYQCCIDSDSNGAYEECVAPNIDGTCDLGYVQQYIDCDPYDGWIFDIADMVSAFWNVDNNGVKVLQIRFYPHECN